MITINDNDLPITAAQKIVCGLKPVTPFQKSLSKALTGEDSDGQDMFSLEDIKEIADYLNVYYENHRNGD